MPAKGHLNFRDRTGEIHGDFKVIGHAGTMRYRYRKADGWRVVRRSLWTLSCLKAGHIEVRTSCSLNSSRHQGIAIRCFECRGWCRYEPGHKQSHFGKGKQNEQKTRATRTAPT